MIPEPRRVAIHQAGHAVIQTLVGHGRFSVVRLSLDGRHGGEWRGLPARGVATLDRQVDLSLYEFGMVTLAGIAAENRYMAMQEPAVDPLVALSDLAEWQEEAWRVLRDEARIRLVGINIMRKLEELLDDNTIWQVVEDLADKLQQRGTLEGASLSRLLSHLPGIAQTLLPTT